MIHVLHQRHGQRGVALLVPATRCLAYGVLASTPAAFPVVVVAFTIAGFANGLEDASWNAAVGTLAPANELLGVLHAAYGVGGALGPLAATALVTRAGARWSAFSYVMAAASALEMVVAPLAFWRADGPAFRAANPAPPPAPAGAATRRRGTASLILRSRIVWICSVFLLIYVGTEVSLGGWTVTFMVSCCRHPPIAHPGASIERLRRSPLADARAEYALVRCRH